MIGAPDFEIVVYGLPAPQGSKRSYGGGRMVESSPYVKPWREAVKGAALDAIHHDDDWVRLDGPLFLAVTFTFARPGGHFRTGRFAAQLRAQAPAFPAVAPDLSKLVRSTEDALTDAGVWADDARVVDTVSQKRYILSGPDTLRSAGAVIRVWRERATVGTT
ncbi:RusA family crossover junction endodeoxyribonuclease [Streptomyces sp. NPDC091212]|uniref:RusA family crossover junction endodeoxyribonuclease n=1 Tax=Streptomyces sp. NPDC091212 TaxID=3155191 RepID=UPI003442D846